MEEKKSASPSDYIGAGLCALALAALAAVLIGKRWGETAGLVAGAAGAFLSSFVLLIGVIGAGVALGNRQR